jgi:hypothetical protein
MVAGHHTVWRCIFHLNNLLNLITKENAGGVVCARLFVYLTQLHVIWLMHDQGTEGLNPRNRILRLVEFVAQETVESAVNNLPIRLQMTTKETIPRQQCGDIGLNSDRTSKAFRLSTSSTFLMDVKIQESLRKAIHFQDNEYSTHQTEWMYCIQIHCP